jgi:hypothetical protein
MVNGIVGENVIVEYSKKWLEDLGQKLGIENQDTAVFLLVLNKKHDVETASPGDKIFILGGEIRT